MKPSSIILTLAVLLAVAASFAVGGYVGRKSVKSVPEKPDTVTVTKWLHDTVEVESSKPAGSVTAMLPLAPSEEEEMAPTSDACTDTIPQNKPDSALVEIPIEEKLCVGENYRAVIRGYNPELVDIQIKQTERYIAVPYRKRWNFSIGPQVGVGITPEGWRPYAGVGITFGYAFEINRNSR